MMGAAASSVISPRHSIVVWEWEENGFHLPYAPTVSNALENTYVKKRPYLAMKEYDPNLTPYCVDFRSMTLCLLPSKGRKRKSSQTGGSNTQLVHHVRRTVYEGSSPQAQGFMWQWDADGSGQYWNDYEILVQCVIHAAYSQGLPHIELWQHFPHMPYTVHLKQQFHQISSSTGFRRNVRIQNLTGMYTPVNEPPTFGAGPIASTILKGTHNPSASQSGMSGGQDRAAESVRKYVLQPQNTKPDDTCSICLVQLSECEADDSVVQLKSCQHVFHFNCLKLMVQNQMKVANIIHLQCPVCKTMYGEKHGNQPDGQMTTSYLRFGLPGYNDCRTICITYNFQSGVQGIEHPNPGMPYHAHAFPRVCYLPDNQKGQKVLRLLRIAFDRRLIFTVGNSITSGRKNVITWNDIHHKTEVQNLYGYGYPDPNYLDNVLTELASHGVTDEN